MKGENEGEKRTTELTAFLNDLPSSISGKLKKHENSSELYGS